MPRSIDNRDVIFQRNATDKEGRSYRLYVLLDQAHIDKLVEAAVRRGGETTLGAGALTVQVDPL